MKIYIHSGGRTINSIEVDANSTVVESLKGFLATTSPLEGQEADFHFYHQDAESALPLRKSWAELGITAVAHVHMSRCKKVMVSVQYAGREYADTFNPANPLKKVFDKAVKHLQIPDEDAAQLYLFLSASGEDKLDTNEHVGSVITGASCSAQLYLCRLKGVQG